MVCRSSKQVAATANTNGGYKNESISIKQNGIV